MDYAAERGPVKPPLDDVLRMEAPGGGTVLESIIEAREAGVPWETVVDWVKEVYGHEYSAWTIGAGVKRAVR
jgi:hypothetical protein